MPIADWLKPGCDDRLVRVGRDLARRRAIELAVDPDDAAEGRHRVGLEGVPVGLDELVVRGEPDRVGVLDDGDGRRRVVAGDAVRGIEVEQVVERRHLALEPGRVGEGPAAVRRLAVERGALVRVLAVAQVVDLLEDEREVAREGVARDLVEVGRDLGVVGGDRAERLGRQLGPRLGAHGAELAQLGDDPRIVGGVGDRGDPGGVAGGRAEQRRAADVDHLDRLVEPDQLDADRRRERLDVDDHEVDQPDPLRAQLLELGGDVAAGQDPGVDRVMERLDLAADVGLALGQLGDRIDLDTLAGEMVTGALGRVDLDVEREEIARERGDAVSVRD